MTLAEYRAQLIGMLDDAVVEAELALFSELKSQTENAKRLELLYVIDALPSAARALRIALQNAERF